MMALLLVSGCTSTSETPAEDAQNVQVHVRVLLADGKELINETVTVHPKITAYDVLKKVATVESKQFAIGKFITAIEGIKPSENEYWAFYIDGDYAQVGTDAFVIEKETELLFKLEKLK